MHSKFRGLSENDFGLDHQKLSHLRTRGFFAGPGISFKEYITDIIYGLFIGSGIIFILLWGALLTGIYFSIIASLIVGAIILTLLLISGYSYAKTSKYFYVNSGIIAFGGVYQDTRSLKKQEENIFIMGTIAKRIVAIFKTYKKTKEILDLGTFIGPLVVVLGGALFLGKYFPLLNWLDVVRNIGILLSPIIVLVIMAEIIKFLFNIFHPLYAFGNLGEKIQKLTPQISEKSKEIQKNFASDMSFKVLSDGFDGLASTFSQIVSLVIRLEKVEQRANKGNLFDSPKYISSLRGDIIGPLRSLRGFLDTRRTELISAQQELSSVRVQVGGTSENRDLASARTEPLITELTDNIGQLDVMIEKMG